MAQGERAPSRGDHGAARRVVLLVEEDRVVAIRRAASGEAEVIGWRRIRGGGRRAAASDPEGIARACRDAIGHERAVDASIGLPGSWITPRVLPSRVPWGRRRRLRFLLREAAATVVGADAGTIREDDVLFPENAATVGDGRRAVLLTASAVRVEALVAALRRVGVRARGASSGPTAALAALGEALRESNGARAGASRRRVLLLMHDGIASVDVDDRGVLALEVTPKAMPRDPRALARVVEDASRAADRDGPGVPAAAVFVVGRVPRREAEFRRALADRLGAVEFGRLGETVDWTLQAHAIEADRDTGGQLQLLPEEISTSRWRALPRATAAAALIAAALLLGQLGAARFDAGTRSLSERARAMRAETPDPAPARAAVTERVRRFAAMRDALADLARARPDPAQMLQLLAAELPAEARLRDFDARQPLDGPTTVLLRGDLVEDPALARVLLDEFLDRVGSDIVLDVLSVSTGSPGDDGVVPFAARLRATEDRPVEAQPPALTRRPAGGPR